MKRETVMRHALVSALLLFGVATLGAGCSGDDSGDPEEVEAAIRAAFEHWNERDADAVVSAFTDAGLVATFGFEGQSAAEVKAGLAEFVGDPPLTDAEFRKTTVEGDTATVEVQAVFGAAYDASRYRLVRRDGAWKIDGEESIEVTVPSGVETIRAETYDFAFNLDTSALAAATAPVALSITNVGGQAHELAIIRVAEDADVLAMFASEAPEFELVGQQGPVEPGEQQKLVFTRAFAPGRYVVLCFLPDVTEGPEGTPHAFKGMLTEFTRR